MVFAFFPVAVFSQSLKNEHKLEKINLTGTHSVTLNLGFTNQTSSVVVSSNDVSTKLNLQGSLSYNYWFSNELAIEGNAGFIAANVNSNTFNNGIVEQKVSGIVPLFMGVKYAPEVLTVSKNIRPFGTVLVGAITGFGTESEVNLLSVKSSTYTESTFAMKTGVGADALLGSLVKIGMLADYLYMPDFEKTIGSRKNYSGFNLSFNVGFMF